MPSGTLPTSISTTNPLGWTSSSTVAPTRAAVTHAVDSNGRVTDVTFDAAQGGSTQSFPPPTVKRPTGAETEAVEVRFSDQPGQYHLGFNDGWCISRYQAGSGNNHITEAPCDHDLDTTRWRFHQGQIVTPTLSGALQPSPNALGARLVVDTGIYQWQQEQFDPQPGSANPPPSDPPLGNPPSPNPLKRVMIVGDSISNGHEGDATWRSRLWQWSQEQNWPVTFVGPLTGTVKSKDPHPPVAPTPTKRQQPEAPNPDPDQFTGAYARDLAEAFSNGASAHYAMWGRQLGQDVPTIEKVMNDLKDKQQLPDVLLVELGFNDIGWTGAGADLVDTMKKFIDNARAANPDVRLVLANLPQRTTLGNANPQLPQRTTAYNEALAKAVTTWNTATSPVALVDLNAAMGCDPTATTCATTYDGLHPNPLGEYRIAQAFGTVLHEKFGVGSRAPKAPGSMPDRPLATPADVKFDGTQQGVTMTWPKVFGAHDYDVQWREVTNGSTSDWTDSVPGAEANRWDLGWQFTNQPYDGHRYEVRVRAAAGDLKSPWSNPVSGIAHPTTAPPPATIDVTPGAGSVDVV
ncbi:GDSL-type esterase/lipase family protein [Kitasatospora cathayae]|uniref:GDSL-type esterase/lipase family protein n=1 Tax=Kitasatospora cathayae TaxID=3004092 RepID=A0ABY7PVX2_9ACTN|nr:GDSL-type esterase/lipase family protein [Kitasatospora sp. HUAS 3-15]WBP84584.1 GDSL-type esterase/lipase family protein [Kitasatospora sp. HUAS 3-15]